MLYPIRFLCFENLKFGIMIVFLDSTADIFYSPMA